MNGETRKPDAAYSGPAADAVPDSTRFRRTLVRVLAVQVITLVLLYALQYTFRP